MPISGRCDADPNCMIEPFPNCFSICSRAASSARSRSGSGRTVNSAGSARPLFD